MGQRIHIVRLNEMGQCDPYCELERMDRAEINVVERDPRSQN